MYAHRPVLVLTVAAVTIGLAPGVASAQYEIGVGPSRMLLGTALSRGQLLRLQPLAQIAPTLPRFARSSGREPCWRPGPGSGCPGGGVLQRWCPCTYRPAETSEP